MPEEFRPSMLRRVIYWLLVLIVVIFDILLIVKHATTVKSTIVIGVAGTAYLLFLLFLLMKPLDVKLPTEDGWMTLPQHDKETK
jgi:natural resistance-associated macrophage protein